MLRLDHHKLLAGDPEMTLAFLRVVNKYLGRFLRDKDLRDVAQSALAEILQKLQAGADPKPDEIVKWTINCASNTLRRELTRLRRQTIGYESRLHNQPKPDLGDIVAARREVERIKGLLALCNARDRRILMAMIAGDTNREIATQHGTSPAAVRSSVARTRKRLRLTLTPEQKVERLLYLASLAGHGSTSSLRPKRDSSG